METLIAFVGPMIVFSMLMVVPLWFARSLDAIKASQRRIETRLAALEARFDEVHETT